MLKKDVNMLSGPIVKGLLAISIPIMVMNVLQSLFNIIDMTILKMYNTGSEYAVGAVGACGMLITLITGLLIGISAGANVVIAKRIGAKDQEGVDRAVGTSVLFSICGGIVLMVIGVIFAEVFLRWTNCPEQLLPEATLYFRLYFLGVPICMLYTFFAAIIRSTGNSRSPMIFSISGGIVKVIFNVVLVAVFKLSVVGVALATIISWILMAVMGLHALLKKGGIVKIRFKYIRFYKKELLEILWIGVPTGMQQGLYSIANVIISSTVNTFGPDATTGISIANQFDGLMYNISIAPSLAVMPYVSQNVGAGNVKRAKEAVGKGMLITVAFGATFGMLSAIFSAQLSSIMSDSPAVIAYSQQKMIIISSTYFICGINEIMGAALKGMGRPIVPMVCTMIFMCAIRFPWVYFVFPLLPSLTFLYLIWPIGWVLSIATLLIFYFPTASKLMKKNQTPTVA